MVNGTYNYSYWGESKPTNITGGPHIVIGDEKQDKTCRKPDNCHTATNTQTFWPKPFQNTSITAWTLDTSMISFQLDM